MIIVREDPDAIVLLTTFDDREGLISDDPDTYFVTAHYTNYPYVLARLSHLTAEAFGDLVSNAWRLAAGKSTSTAK